MQIRMKDLSQPQTSMLKMNRNILFVDDEPSILDAYKTILTPPKARSSRRMRGQNNEYPEYNLFFASSGEEAVEIYKEQLEKNDPIGVGFFDMLMPGGMDGAQTIQALRKLDPSLVCVIVTAYADRDPKDIREFFEDQSMWLYMNKPFNDGEIRQLAANMVHSWNLRRENNNYRERLEALVKQRTEQLNDELRKVAIVQRNLLPQQLPDRDGVEMGVYYETCVELGGGGDYYDVVELPENRLGIAIADASGHGPSAACIMAITRAMFRSLVMDHPNDPAKVLTQLNKMVEGNYPRGHFVTMLYAIIDLNNGKVTYANAGHPFPIYGKGSQFQADEGETGMILGMFPVEYQSNELQLQKEDHFLLFTDGIEEHRDANKEQFGYSRILEACRQHGDDVPQMLINGIVKEADQFNPGAPREDDFTFIGIRWN